MTPVALPTGWRASRRARRSVSMLAGLDPRRAANNDTVTVLAARYRQLAHEQARLLEALVEVGRSDLDDPGGTSRLDAVGERAGGEIAATLTLTGVAADRELGFADAIVTGLPAVHAALSVGRLDRGKAWVFADHLADLPADQAALICAALLPIASGLTTGQLRARLARMLHDIDPEHARRRYQRAVRERAVIGCLASDGSVTVTATGLPTDEAATACERLDVLAHAVQRAGHPGRLGQIQTDLFLGMLDGSFHHLSEPEIVAALLHRSRPEDAAPDGPPTATAESPIPEAEARPETERTGSDSHAAAQTTAADVDSTGTRPPDDAAAVAEPPADAETGGVAVPRVGVEIRVGLTTLLGLDERCGEVPGLGPVLPHVARTLVAAQYRGAEWRFAIVDSDGQLLLAGTTRRRPAIAATDRGRCRDGIVELHIDADTLTRLAAGPERGPWSGVLADLADQYARWADRLAPLDQRPDDRFARARPPHRDP